MPVNYIHATGKSELEAASDVMDIAGACAATGMSSDFIRAAINKGKLKAFIPGGGDPRRIGRGPGYRIRKRELQRWWLGEEPE